MHAMHSKKQWIFDHEKGKLIMFKDFMDMQPLLAKKEREVKQHSTVRPKFKEEEPKMVPLTHPKCKGKTAKLKIKNKIKGNQNATCGITLYTEIGMDDDGGVWLIYKLAVIKAGC